MARPMQVQSFWERLREVIVEAGFRENQISKALYSLTDKDGKVIALICTHVDDMLWAAKPEAESAINNIFETFAVRKVEEGKFRFCGKEVTQTDDFAVTVTCKDSADQIERLSSIKARAHD